MEENERRINVLEKAQEEFRKRLDRVENTLAITGERYTNIMREIEKMSEILEEMRNRPAKNWGTLVSSGISAIAGAVVAMLIKGGI